MPRSLLAARSALAIAQMVEFYLVALTILGGLLLILWAEWMLWGSIRLWTALVFGIPAIVVAWCTLPWPDFSGPPGPRLSAAQHPRLFAVLSGIATKTGHAMPQEVYLSPDVNASVSSRGGILGFRSRRVMELGLPLMQLLDVTE